MLVVLLVILDVVELTCMLHLRSSSLLTQKKFAFLQILFSLPVTAILLNGCMHQELKEHLMGICAEVTGIHDMTVPLWDPQDEARRLHILCQAPEA